MSALPSVAIVILNWDGKKYLEQFLPAVLQTTYGNLRVIVADNASTDDSINFLKQQFSNVELIELQKNFGFAKGYNDALKKVDADYYVLLNSDVEVTPDWLQPIISLLEKDESYAACQPKILSFHDKNKFEYAGAAGGWIDAFGYPFSRGRVFDICEEDNGQYDEAQQVFWASGAALVIKSSAYHKMNGFDEYFFAHQEEIDLCWRLQLAGYKVFCEPQSVVYHVGGGSLPQGASKKTFLNFRNNHIMLFKNLPWREKWWKIQYRIYLDSMSALKELLQGNAGYWWTIYKAHLAFFYWLFFAKKSWKPVRVQKFSTLKGVHKGNIAWLFFVKKKKTFSTITEVQ